jgi:hypothetical protein
MTMDNPRIVAALRAGEPEAIAALFDAHATELFRYSWFLLRSREAAQIAVRDALAVAVAHPDAVPAPGQLREWLYALTRAECARRRPVPAMDADEPPARPSQPDADGRVLAWNTVASMDTASAEILELTIRANITVPGAAFVLGKSREQVAGLLEAARNDVVRFLEAYVVARRAGFDCQVLTRVISGWGGSLTAALRDRVLAHARECATCRTRMPQNVSVARVYGLLPDPVPHEGMRDEVLSWFADPRYDGYRTFAAARAAAAAVPASAGVPAPVPAVPAPAPGVMPPAVPEPEPAVPEPAPVPPARVGHWTAGAEDDTNALPVLTEARHTKRHHSSKRIVAGLVAAGVAAVAAATFALIGLPGATPTANMGHRPIAGRMPGQVNGASTRPGAVAAVRVGDHSRDPFQSPSAGSLYLEAKHQGSSSSAPPSPRSRVPRPPRPPHPSHSPTPKPTPSWQRAPSPTPTPTPTPSPSATPTPTPSQTPSATPPISPPPSPSATPPATPPPSPSATPPPSPSATPSANSTVKAAS